jgi:integrase
LDNIDIDLCEGFKTYLLSKLSINSAVIYFLKLKLILKYAVDNELIDKNPAQKINIKGQEHLPRFLTITELQKLISTDCPREEIKRAFLFGVFTGLRISDIRQLQWSNIKEGHIEIRQQKTQKINRIPLSTPAQRILDNIEQKGELVFYLPPMSRGIGYYLDLWSQSAEIPRFTFLLQCFLSPKG